MQDPHDLYHTSAAVLRVHEAKAFPGAVIASLSIPWGFAKSDDDLGGYHLVWPRDLVETAGGLLAAGVYEDAKRVVDYLQVTQEADGHWPQNMWLDGTPYWNGLQMDETALPILLVDQLLRADVLHATELERWWPMVRSAASYIVRNGTSDTAGPVGGGSRLFAVHACCRNRCVTRGCRPGGSPARTGGCHVPARTCRFLERQY